MTIDTCGRSLTFGAPPRWVVVLWRAPTEMLLALGAQGDVAAIAGSCAPLPEDLAAAAEGIPTIAGPDPVRVAFHQGGTGPVHVLAGGIYDSEITTAGGRNVFDADVVLVGTYDGQDFETDASPSVMDGLARIAAGLHPQAGLPVPTS